MKLLLAFVAVTVAVACSDRLTVAPADQGPHASISDARHEFGNAHFYFLPPLVPDPAADGTFEGALLSHTIVEICRLESTGCAAIANFSATSTTQCGSKDATPPAAKLLRIVADDELYVLNWDTNECGSLDLAATYRIRVLVAGTELGHADVDVVASGRELRNVNTGEYVGLVDGRTLPIKFRVERGAVFPVGPEGGQVRSTDGRLVLTIPPAVLQTEVGVTIHPVSLPAESDGFIPGTAWDLRPSGLSFLEPVELEIAYDPRALPAELVDPATSLVVGTLDNGIWSETVSAVDAGNGRVFGLISGFSVKGVVLKTIEIDATPTSISFAPGRVATVSGTPLDARGLALSHRLISYETSNDAVAIVDPSGIVRAIGPGTAAVTLSLAFPKPLPTNPCATPSRWGPIILCQWPIVPVPVDVSPPVAVVHVMPANATVAIDGTLVLAAVLLDDQGNVLSGRIVEWLSQDEGIARVSSAGIVTGVEEGTVTIEARSEGRIGLLSITVSGREPQPVWTKVAAGSSHSCAIRSAVLYCWGQNTRGQLGATSSETCSGVSCSRTPLLVSGGLRFSHVTTGLRHTCALTEEGIAYCWGDNTNGQLGIGSTAQLSAAPFRVAGGMSFISLVAGLLHTCALRADGAAFCWGNNSQGQVGNGAPRQFTADFPRSPVRVLGGESFVQIAGAGGHTCALTSDGIAYCWGSNLVGQLGTSTATSCTSFNSIPCSSIPIPVSTELRFSQIVAGGVLTGGSQTCGLMAPGDAYCWGSNEFGELGIGSSLARTNTPMSVVGGFSFSTLTAGAGHTCGILTTEAPVCWGRNQWGESGDGTALANRPRPTMVQGSLRASFISASESNGHTCVTTTDGGAYCWGLNNMGQLGDGSTSNRSVPVRVRNP